MSIVGPLLNVTIFPVLKETLQSVLWAGQMCAELIVPDQRYVPHSLRIILKGEVAFRLVGVWGS